MTNTNPSIDPNQTYALVVGIEQYQYHGELDGPAQEAIRFASWLRSKHVPKANIFLFVSFLDKNEFLRTNIDITIQLPTESNIRDILDRVLLQRGTGGQLLHVFWGGHGFITRRGRNHFTRRLYYQDSDGTNFYNLNLEALEEALKTSPDETGFRYQFFIVDTCAHIIDNEEHISSYETSETSCRVISGDNINIQEIFYGAPKFGVSTGELSSLFLTQILKESNLFPNANILYAALKPIVPTLTYRRFNSDYHQFEEDGYSSSPRTILADRHKIIAFLKQIIKGLSRERIILVNSQNGKERNLLRKRLEEEADNCIVMDLRSAERGVCYVFHKIAEELGAENFPLLCNRLKSLLGTIDLSNSEVLEERRIDRALWVQLDEREERLSGLTYSFFQDLSNINRQEILIIIDGYDRPNHIVLTSELLQWMRTKFISGISQLHNQLNNQLNNQLILVILGDCRIENYADIAFYCQFYELIDDHIEFDSWKSYTQRMGYQLSDDEIHNSISLGSGLSDSTDFIYKLIESIDREKRRQ